MLSTVAGNQSSISETGRDLNFAPPPGRPCNPRNVLFNRWLVLLPQEWSGKCLKLTATHLYLDLISLTQEVKLFVHQLKSPGWPECGVVGDVTPSERDVYIYIYICVWVCVYI
jgi:hypothetical protein